MLVSSTITRIWSSESDAAEIAVVHVEWRLNTFSILFYADEKQYKTDKKNLERNCNLSKCVYLRDEIITRTDKIKNKEK